MSARTDAADDLVGRLDWLIAAPALPATGHREERYTGTAGRVSRSDVTDACAVDLVDAEHAAVGGTVLRDQTAGQLGLTRGGAS